MRLLAGATLYVDGIAIKPFTLREINDMGYSEFQNHINMISLTLDYFIDQIEDFETQAIYKSEKHNMKVFDLYCAIPDFKKMMIDSLKVILRTNDIIETENDDYEIVLLVDGKYGIDRYNYDTIIKTISMQNSPSEKNEEESETNPENEEARAVAEKIKKLKNKVSEVKNNGSEKDSGTFITDIISSVSSMSNTINKINVWDLTLYQLYDEFYRLLKIEEYRFTMQASMFASEVEIPHWAEPL